MVFAFSLNNIMIELSNKHFSIGEFDFSFPVSLIRDKFSFIDKPVFLEIFEVGIVIGSME